MSTIYSLVCWGGKDGKTATMTIASPCVITITNHGLSDGFKGFNNAVRCAAVKETERRSILSKGQ